MRLQKVSLLCRYVAFFVMVIYLYSFGTFMSRTIEIVPSSLERHRVTSLLSESTRSLASDEPKSTLQLPQNTNASSTSQGFSMLNQIQMPKSIPQSVIKVPLKITVLSNLSASYVIRSRKEAKFQNRTTTVLAYSKPEMAKKKPEVAVEHAPEGNRMDARLMFQRKNDTVILKVNSSSEVVLRHSKTNWTEAINASGDHVVNPHPFKYLINAESLCSRNNNDNNDNDNSVFIIVYIHSAPRHYKRRSVIRQTWGDSKQYPVDIRIVFVIGSPANSGVQRALAFEAEQYGDIVQEDFLDSYKNLTYKGIAALKWISSFCNRAKFVLKTDDDIFVNMFTLIRHLQRLESKHGGTVNHLLMCLVWNGMPVLRSGKWGVSKDEWKEDTYPTYCSGSAFVMSTDVAISFHNVSYEVPFFWVDDLYITGLLPLKLGTIKHTQFIASYQLSAETFEEKFTGAQWFKYIFCHVSDLTAILNVWKKLVAIEKGEIVPSIHFLIPQDTSASTPTPK